MNVAIRVGASSYFPYWYLTKSNTYEGVLAPYILETIVSTLNGINLTFLPIASLIGSKCPANGICTQAIHNLQVGDVDFILPAPLTTLDCVGINLTTASTDGEDGCYLGYKKKLKVNVDYSTFFGFIFEFGPWFWLSLLCLFSIFPFIFVLTIKHKTPSTNIIDVIWMQIECILLQNFNPLIFTPGLFQVSVLFMFSLLLFGTLLSSSLKTGLVAQIDYLKLETFNDIIKYDYKPFVQETCQCLSDIQNDPRPIAREILSKLFIMDSIEKAIFGVKHDQPIEINYRPVLMGVKSYRCLDGLAETHSESYHISNSPVYKSRSSFLINKNNEPTINKIIINRSYQSFEAGLLYNPIMHKIRLKCFHADQPLFSCMNRDFKIDPSFEQITLHYLLTPLILLLSGLSIASLVMVFCLIISNNN